MRILIDCGLQQGRDEVDNRALPFAPGSIDYVLVTHAHIDHSGRIPMLIKKRLSGPILTTRPHGSAHEHHAPGLRLYPGERRRV